jgi:hypothetical protein
MHASGTFEVKLAPPPSASGVEPARLGRMSLDRHFLGGLEATSLGEMLSAGTAVAGSTGYVAIERVIGRLEDFGATIRIEAGRHEYGFDYVLP